MRDDDEVIGLQLRLVPEDAVLGDADAVEARAERRQAPDHRGLAERADDPAHQRPEHHHVPEAGDEEERGAEQHGPEAAPEGAPLAPELHAVAGVVEADHVLLGVVVLPHDRELLHVEARALEGAQRLFGLGMRAVDGHHGVDLLHLVLLCSLAGAPAVDPITASAG